MVELTDFLRNLTTQNLGVLAEQARAAPLFPDKPLSPTTEQQRTTLQTFLFSGQLPPTQTEAVVTQNLLGLGRASIDISQALSEQVTIREQQRAFDQETARNTQIALGQVNERLSRQITELGDSLSGISTGGFDPIKFFTDNPLIGGIGIGGLAVGAVVLLLLIKR